MFRFLPNFQEMFRR